MLMLHVMNLIFIYVAHFYERRWLNVIERWRLTRSPYAYIKLGCGLVAAPFNTAVTDGVLTLLDPWA